MDYQSPRMSFGPVSVSSRHWPRPRRRSSIASRLLPTSAPILRRRPAIRNIWSGRFLKPAAGGSIKPARRSLGKRAKPAIERRSMLVVAMTRSWLSHKAFESLVQEALKGLPHEFRQCLKNVAIEIEEEPNNQALRALGIADDDPDELLGLYVGRSIQGHSFFDVGGELPDPVDRKSTRPNSSHQISSYAVFCLQKETPIAS